MIEPSSPKLKAWVTQVRGLVLNDDRDCWILNTGDERGGGKSNLAYYIGKALSPRFGPKNMIFDTDDLMDAANHAERGDVLVLDEAINGAFALDWNSPQNKRFQKFGIVCGEKGLIIIINVPKKGLVGKYLRDHRAEYWILNHTRQRKVFHRIRRSDYKDSVSWPKQFGLLDFPDASAIWPEEWTEYTDAKAQLSRDIAEANAEERWIIPERELRRASQKVAILGR